MNTPDDSFARCLDRLSAGEQDAARDLYERFVGQLVALAARKLDRRLGAKADPEAVAHSAFVSFFVRHNRGSVEVHNWGMLFGLLAHITACKALNRNRYHRQQRRDERGVVGPEDWQCIAKEPGPAEEVEVSELLESALKGVGGDERRAIEAYLDGAAVPDVARRAGLSVRSVQRILHRFRSRLRELLDQ